MIVWQRRIPPCGCDDEPAQAHRGDGYTYLTRQVAAHDATDRGYDTLGAYYTEKGETPGVWMGSGLAGIDGLSGRRRRSPRSRCGAVRGGPCTRNAARAANAAMRAAGATEQRHRRGQPPRARRIRSSTGDTMFRRRGGEAPSATTTATTAVAPDTPVPAEDRARIRTEVARAMFADEHGREPVDARELSGHIARISRPADHRGRRVRPDVLPGEVVSHAVGGRPTGGRGADRAGPPRRRRRRAGVHRGARPVHPRAAPTGSGRSTSRGLVAAAFTHRDSRAGDPDLHTHVAVANKVQTLAGRWLVHRRAGAVQGQRRRLRDLQHRPGEAPARPGSALRFAERPGTDRGKRPVREIVGVDPAT